MDPELIESDDAPFVDAHCHLDDPALDARRSAIVREAGRVGVGRFVIGGYSPATYPRARSLRSRSIRVGVGIHPWAVDETDDATLDAWVAALPELLRDADAFGEIGLDRTRARRRGGDLGRQTARLHQLLALGRDADRPLVLHVVHAHAEAQALVRDAGVLPPVVVHGFVGGPEVARGWLALGAHLSFGPDTLRSERTLDASRLVPLGRLLVESDAPHGPAATREVGPAIVAAVAAALATRRGVVLGEIAAASRSNAERLFFARDPGA